MISDLRNGKKPILWPLGYHWFWFWFFDILDFFSGASDDATSDSGSSLADADDDDFGASRSSLDLSEHETQRESD